MSDIFADRPFPGYPNRPLRDPGDWQDFEPDPLWSDSVLRVRTLYGARSAQFAGTIVAELPADTEASIGVLPSAFRPVRAYRFIVSSAYAQWADLTIRD